MLKAIVNFLNLKLELLNYFDLTRCLCELKTKGDVVAPKEYIANGEWQNIDFDSSDGVSYWRLRDPITVTRESNPNKALKRVQTTVPMKLVFSVRRDKLTADDAYSFDRIRQTIVKQFNIDNGALTTALGAAKVTITAPSSDGDPLSVWESETSGTGTQEPDFKYVFGSVDIDIVIDSDTDCLPTECDDVDSDILHTFNFCDSAVIDRLTPEQVTCLESTLCGTPDPVTEQINGVTIGTAASGTTNNQVIENTNGDAVGTEANPSVVPDATVQLNGVDMVDIPSGETDNIEVRQSTGATQVGSKQGVYWRVEDSTVENSDASYSASIKAEGSLVIPDTPISANGDLIVNQPSTIAKDVVVRYETQGVVPTTIVSGEVVVPDVVGGTLTIGVYSDAGHTTPITSADFGDTVYIKGVVTGITATRYYIYIDNGIVSRLPQDNVTGEFSYDVNLYGTINIVIIAVDASTGVAQSAPFELTVAELFPPDIAGCALWINADRLDTYTFNGVNVSQQDDLSGNSNNISAPASANEPLYLDTGAGLNGLRSVRYDGSEYQVASGLSLDIVSGNSIFIVVEFTASDTGGIISNGENISDGSAYFFLQQLGLSVRTYGGGASYSSSYPVVVGTKYLFEIHRTTAQEVFLINGVEQHTRAIGTAGNRNNFYVNTSFGGNSSSVIADIDVHNAALTNAQKQDIRNYLTDKWAI